MSDRPIARPVGALVGLPKPDQDWSYSLSGTLAGWTPINALMLWIVQMVRAMTSIVYVRARLRLERGEQAQIALPRVAHGAGLLLICALGLAGLVPWSAALAIGILTVRALIGLSRNRRPTHARNIGFQVLGYGLLTVLLAAIGYRY